MLKLQKTAAGFVVLVEGGDSFPLPAAAVLKENALQAAAEIAGEESEAVQILKDCELDYEIVPGKDAVEELIGVVVTTSPEYAAILQDAENPLLPEVMGALLEACPDLGSERIVARSEDA
jgi:hypothetical protein